MHFLQGLTKKRRFRVAAAAAIVGAVLASGPFVFTTPLVRYYLAHSDFAPYGITFEKARLSPTGSLSIDNLVIQDVEQSARETLVSADRVRLDFSWTQVWQQRMQTVDVSGLQVYLRAGREQPLTIMSLLKLSDYVSGSPSATTRPAARVPLWFDQLLLSGMVHVEGFEAWQKALPETVGGEIPLQLRIQSSGSRDLPTRNISLLMGERDVLLGTLPSLGARLTIKPQRSGDYEIAIDGISLRRCHAVLSAVQLSALIPGFDRCDPAFQRAFDSSADAIQLSGKLTLGGASQIDVNLDVGNFAVAARPENPPLNLDNCSLQARIQAPLDETFRKTLRISGATISWDALQCGPWRLSRASADFELDNSGLDIIKAQAAFSDGTLVCSAIWPLDARFPSRGTINARAVNAARILARLPDDLRNQLALTVDGTLSGKLTFTSQTDDKFSGYVELGTGDDFQIQSSRTAGLGAVVLHNASINGQMDWSGNAQEWPALTKGMFHADGLSLAGFSFKDLSADVLFQDQIVSVKSLHSVLGQDSRLTFSGSYDFSDGSIAAASLSASHVTSAALASWLPAGMEVETAADLSVMLTRPSAQDDPYAINATLVLPERSTISLNEGLATISGHPVVAAYATVARDFQSSFNAQIKAVGFKAVGVDDALLQQLTHLPSHPFKNGLTLSWYAISAALSSDSAHPHLSAIIDVSGLDGNAMLDSGSAFEVKNCSLNAAMASPWSTADPLRQVTCSSAIIALDKLTSGTNTLGNLHAQATLDKGQLVFSPEFKVSFAGGTITGTAQIDLPMGSLASANLKFTHLDQAVLTANLAPDRFTAEGMVSGEVAIKRNDRDQLVGNIELATEGPGVLHFDHETAEKQIAPVAREAALAVSTLPPTFDQIVTDQLANYPYSSGMVKASDQDGELRIHLDYSRTPLMPGDPGYGVKVQIAGRDVLANYPISLKWLTVTIPQTSVAQVVAKATGFFESHAAPRKLTPSQATQPAATAPAAAQAATSPAEAASMPASSLPDR